MFVEDVAFVRGHGDEEGYVFLVGEFDEAHFEGYLFAARVSSTLDVNDDRSFLGDASFHGIIERRFAGLLAASKEDAVLEEIRPDDRRREK